MISYTVLGDVVDRGTEGMKVLLNIAQRDNVILLRGNHDHQAYVLLKNLDMLFGTNVSEELVDMYGSWISDGGKQSLEEYLALTEKERETIIKVLGSSAIKKELEINGKKFLLAHTVPEVDVFCDYEQWTLEDYIWGEPDYEEVYFEDRYIVTGHTPTGYIDANVKGKIWMGNNHIAVDCGCVFGNPLGCLCLDTFEEFYVM